MMNISIVIPCYNEFLNLKHIVQGCKKIIKDNKNHNIEFILVDNGSTDSSSFFFQKLKHDKIRVLTIKKNLGYGNGIIQGLHFCSHEILAWTHADLQTELSDIINGLKHVNNKNILVKGRRVSRKIFPKILSLGMTLYAYFKLGFWINEINAQPKIFKKDFFIEIIDKAPKDFSLDLFFCLEAIKRGRIKEFNVYFKKRLYETSKGGGGTLIQKFKIIKRTIDYINKTKR